MKKLLAMLACGMVVGAFSSCSHDKLAPTNCSLDSDCEAGYTCVEGTCTLKKKPAGPDASIPAGPDASLPPGPDAATPPECILDKDCAPGFACLQGTCVQKCGPDGAPCDDGNPCTQGDYCSVGECKPGTPVADGTACDLKDVPATKDICLKGACVASRCGDGFVDKNATPPEECDDGNTTSGDGCEANCTILPPTLTIDFPTRGATLDGDGQVTAMGVAADKLPGVKVTVNGQSAAVAADGSWQLQLAAQYGVNSLEVIATNTAGKTARRTVGFYYSSKYLPFAHPATSTARISHGLVTHLAQGAIDDHNHPCSVQGGVYTCSQINDLATLGEITLNNLDLQSSIGSLTVYQSTNDFLTKSYDFICNDCMGLTGFTAGGTIKLDGKVNIKSQITALDFNALKLRLDAQTGGLQADVSVSQTGTPPTPGFSMTLRTTAEVPVVAKFDPATIQLTYQGFNTIPAVCGLLFDPSTDSPAWLGYLCPHGVSNDLDPLASLDPQSYADSGLTIGSMLMENTFTISAAPGGGVQVTLQSGIVQFQGSTIDVVPIENMVVDFGNLQVLGLSVPLGQYPLTGLVSDLSSVISDIASLFLNDLQTLTQLALSQLLFNPSDPLSVGQLVKTALESTAPEGPIVLAKFAGQSVAPEVSVASTISAINCAPMTGSNLLSGGITPSLDMLFSSTKVVQRDPLGTILAEGCYGSPPPALFFPHASPLEDAYYVDTINQALFAVWWNGGFDMPFTDSNLSQALPGSLDVTAFSATTKFLASPILGNCGTERLTLQVADIHVAGSFTVAGAANSFEAYVSAKIPVNIATSAGAPVLQRASGLPTQFVIEIVSSPTLPSPLNDTLTALLQTVLVDEILVRYGSQVTGALPQFRLDLSALAPGQKAAVLKLDAKSASTSAGYTILSGDLSPF